MALAWLAWRLGEWQFDRLEERKERNALIERNESLPPVDVREVLAPGEPVAEEEEWRVVTATGSYDEAATVIVRYRTREGAPGVEVVVPLELGDGSTLLVDRGWFGTDNRGATPSDVPPPPQGQVTVTGWVREDATGDEAEVTDQSTRAISSEQIGEALDREVLGGFVQLESESPEPEQPLEPAELPELDDGPHFFYGLQWWFFGALAIFGFFYLLYDEWRGGRRTTPGSERPEHAAVDGDHRARDE
ncbi:SURF1 family protein [Nocardioides gansuensis]|uniref:SURF1-like protein n=2 Tax=Nocardioides gansuensis TaxID=2138300 RepID=A0A2T8FBG1_9ACTN|nr:SURF1 family protein [Nocardioides gansuensis]